MSAADIVIPKELDYREKVMTVPKYKIRVINPVNAVTLSQTTEVTAEFTFPSNVVMNFDSSRLDFELTLAAQGATKFSAIHLAGNPMIKGLSVVTERGKTLVDMSNVQAFSRMVLPYTTRASKWKNMPGSYYSTSGFGRADQLYDNVASGESIAYDGSFETNSISYDQIQEYEFSAANTANAIHFSIPFSQFKHTLLANPTDLYFCGEYLTLRIIFAETNSYCLKTDTADSAGFAAGVVPTAGTSFSVAPTIRLALQNNPEISSAVINRVMREGLAISIPWVHEFKATTDTSTSYINNQMKFNLGRGNSLLRVYSALVRNGTYPVRWNINNSSEVSWSGVRSAVNSQYESDSVLNTDDVWELLHDTLLKDSIIWNPKTYQQHCVYISDFSGLSGVALADAVNVASGVSLAVPLDYQVEFVKAGTAMTFYSFGITSKTLRLTPAGVEISLL